MKQRLLEKFNKEVAPKLKEKFAYKSSMEIPKITKVVVNVGIGKLGKDQKLVDKILSDIQKITGQKPVMVKAKKSIAGFKLREGSSVGIAVTLRRNRMFDFLDRFISIALPRSKDFGGIKLTSVDDNGNLNIGIKEQTIFPEISYESLKEIFSFQINVSTTAKSRDEGLELFRLLGIPLKS